VGQGGRQSPFEAETFLAFGRSMEAASLRTFLKFGNAKSQIQFVLFLQKNEV